ncbi:MAG: hypothetical protein QXO62_00240 [Thermoproteota archaeon]
MTRTVLEVEFLEGMHNVIPNRTISELIVKNMREVGPPKYSEDSLKFAQEIAKTISPEAKVHALKKSGRPNWETLANKLIDDEVPDPWGEGMLDHVSTDVADVSWKAPTVEFSTAAWVLGTPGHSWQSTAQSASELGHESLIFAAKVIAGTLIDLIVNPELVVKARDEHQRRLGNKKYKSPLPLNKKPPLDAWEK